MHEDRGEEGSLGSRGVHSQLPERCQLLCPWDLLVTLVTGGFTRQQIQWHRRVKGIPWPRSHSSWELVMEGGTQSRHRQKQPLLQHCRAKEMGLIRSDSWQLAGDDCLPCCSWGAVCSEYPAYAVFLPAGSSCPAAEVQEEQEVWACLPSSAHLRAAKYPPKKGLGDSM